MVETTGDGAGGEPTWTYRVSAEGGLTTVALTGEIDLTGAGQLRSLLTDVVRDAGVVNMDASGLRFIDSTVLSALIAVRNNAVAAGRRFAVVNPSAQVSRVLEMTGTLHVLTADIG